MLKFMITSTEKDFPWGITAAENTVPFLRETNYFFIKRKRVASVFIANTI